MTKPAQIKNIEPLKMYVAGEGLSETETFIKISIEISRAFFENNKTISSQ